MDGDRRSKLTNGPLAPTDIAVHSAGGVICLDHGVVLISTRRGTRWQLPKGRLQHGESAGQAAVREVFEETGIEAEIVQALPTIEFIYLRTGGQRVAKRVDFFLMRPVGGSIENYSRQEVTSAEWVSWGEANRRLTYENERQVLVAAEQSRASALLF